MVTKTLKVLIVTPEFPPDIAGPATYTAELLSRLPPKCHPTVVSFTKVSRPDLPSVNFVPISGGSILRQLRLLKTTLLKAWPVDIIYSQDPFVVGLASFFASLVLRKHLIVKFVGDPSWETARSLGKTTVSPEVFLSLPATRSFLIFKVTKFVLTNSRKVITPGYNLKKLLVENYQLPAGQIVVIPNSVDQKKLSLPKRPDSLVFVGRLVSWKNVDLLLEALKKLPQQVHCHLEIVGDGPLRQKLEHLAIDLKPSIKVSFTGSLSHTDALEHLATSETLLLYSDYEGLSHVLLEGLSQGTVPIASDIPANREIVVDGKTGLLVPLKDPSALARAIQNLLKDKMLLKRLSKNGQEVIKTKFSWEINLNLLVNLFYEITKK